MSEARGDVLARVAFAVLVLASFAALLITQRLKHSPPLIQNRDAYPSFAPGDLHARYRTEHISFTPTVTDTLTLTIRDAAGGTVATLLRAVPAPRYARIYQRWSGRRDGGAPAPRGTYTAEVHLAARDVTFAIASFRLLEPLPR